jgi:hypothetical protein
MAITDENLNTTMLVQPSGSCNYGNNCGGFFGGGDSWLGILFLIALLNGGWGGFGGFGGGYGAMMGMGMMDGFGLYPWLNNSQNINDGFRTQALGTQVGGIQNSITAGFGDVQTALCGGFAGVNQNISNGTAAIQNGMCNGFNGVNQSINGAQNAITQQMYNNQISDLERSFAAQTANTAAITALQAQNADCCCRTQTNIADLKYAVATENCADRTQAMQNTRDIIDAQTRNTQAVLDKLCQIELDGVKAQVAAEQRENANLRSELMYARGQASQVDQTAQLRAFAATTANQAIAELRSCPIPSQPVYGNQPIFTCNGNNAGCGCGCAVA